MGIKYEDIKKANDTIKTTDIRGKAYSEVSQRIKAFRMVYPDGFIHNTMLSNENGVCVFRSEVGYFTEDGSERVLGVGTAYEKESANFINKTSYIEVCETSACGRALGMVGFGIDVSVSSADEVQTAINNQEQKEKPTPKATPKQIEFLTKAYGDNLPKLLAKYKLNKIEDMAISVASELVKKIKEAK